MNQRVSQNTTGRRARNLLIADERFKPVKSVSYAVGSVFAATLFAVYIIVARKKTSDV